MYNFKWLNEWSPIVLLNIRKFENIYVPAYLRVNVVKCYPTAIQSLNMNVLWPMCFYLMNEVNAYSILLESLGKGKQLTFDSLRGCIIPWVQCNYFPQKQTHLLWICLCIFHWLLGWSKMNVPFSLSSDHNPAAKIALNIPFISSPSKGSAL